MSESSNTTERYPELDALPWLVHGFVVRQAGVDTAVDRGEALCRLERGYREAVSQLGFPWEALHTAEQVHGSGIAVISADAPHGNPAEGMDGLITAEPGVLLGILVADCCAVFVVDRKKRVIGLLHSGKKGTEGEIVPRAIRLMQEKFGSRPADLVVRLSPCIRPPHYEIDFASAIRAQAQEAGIDASDVHDDGTDTARDLERYYSYRVEKGKTGRMLALLGRCRIDDSIDLPIDS